MIPGIVQLGILTVLLQVVVILGFYRYANRRLPSNRGRSYAKQIIASGVILVVIGQLVGFGAITSFWQFPGISLEHVIAVQNAGTMVAALGYLIVVIGFVLYSRPHK